MTTVVPALNVDFSSREFAQNPFPTYEVLRKAHPVFFVEQDQRYVLSRYDDVYHALLDHDTFAAASDIIGSPEWIEEAHRRNLFILTQDPPAHKISRDLVSKAFTPRILQALEAEIENIAEGLVNNIKPNREMDFLESFALPYAVGVISLITGDTRQNVDELRYWAQLVDKNTRERPADEHVEALIAATKKQYSIYDSIINERKSSPRSDIVSALLAARVDGRGLTDGEVRSALDLFVSAGFQSSALFLANCVLILAEQKSLFSELAVAEDQGRLAQFIDEALRFNPPAHAVLRRANRTVELHGITIPKGALVSMLIASANRDETIFDNADVFIPGRKNIKRHIAFGHGVHTCLGSHLAKIEVRVALKFLLEKFSRVDCCGDVTWTNALVIRALQSLPTRWF